MKQYVVAFDPGLSGGMAVYQFDVADGTEKILAFPMPTTKNTAGKDCIDIPAIKHIIFQHIPPPSIENIGLVVLEKVGARPGQGVTSMFTFGTGVGEIKGAMRWIGVSIIEVMPQKWKKEILSGTKKDKNAAIGYILGRFPDVSLKKGQNSKVNHDGMAEACCLALYGKTILRNC